MFWRRMRRGRAAAGSGRGAGGERSPAARRAPPAGGAAPSCPVPSRHGGRAAEQPAGAAAAPLGPRRPQQAAPAAAPAGVSTAGPRRAGRGRALRVQRASGALTRGSSLSRGFTFKKTSPAVALPREPRGLSAASALRDKDVNTSLAALASSLPASKDKKAQIQDFFPAAGSPHGRGPEPPCASPALARSREASKGPAASGKRSVTEGLRGAPAREAGPGPAAGPVITIEDEWDDIDDFDLSGIEKKYCRPPVLSPKGQRAACKASQRSNPCLDEPPGSPPGTVGNDTGPRSRSAPEHGEASPEAEQRPLSQQSLICLEDSAPCSGNKSVGEGLWENLSADVILDDGREEAHPGNNLF